MVDGHPDQIGFCRHNPIEAKCRFKADDSMGHTLTREDDAMFEVERKSWPNIQASGDLPNNSAINRSLESLTVDSMFLHFGRTNYGHSVSERAETTQQWSSGHISERDKASADF